VCAEAPAKVNLTLAVGERGADGYHSLSTVFQAVDLWERVNVRSGGEPGVRIAVSGQDATSVPRDGSNLAARAACALARRAGVEPALDIQIDKAIPVAGGLAGGSADAAATLVACNELWQAGLGTDDLAGLAEPLGADVPFVLRGGTALGRGRGEVLEPLTVGAPMWWTLAMGVGGLSTPQIFAAWDRGGQVTVDRSADNRVPEVPASLGRPVDLIDALAKGDLMAVGGLLGNDLQPFAIKAAPAIQGTLEAVLGAGALGAVVSGSGPTVIALAESRSEAIAAAAMLQGLPGLRAAIVAKAVPDGARLSGQGRSGT
jgi:4-diphosphocytidyl-2-C-methyl-D-erythritol kinase